MKKLALILAISVFASFLPSYVLADTEYTYVAVKDTTVKKNLPNENFGGLNSIESNCVTGDTRCIGYYGFDISEKKNDDAAILTPPNSQLGFWYVADITVALDKLFQGGVTKLDMQIVPTNITNANINGRFYSHEAEFNKPYLKIRFSNDGKSIKSAMLYFFGATNSHRVEINSIIGEFDEMKVTYATKPYVSQKLGYAYRNAELSGRPATEPIETIDGLSYESAMSTTLKSFEGMFPDYVHWDDIYDKENVPTAKELVEAFEGNPKAQEHPRILGGREDWENVRRWYKEGNEFVVKWAEQLLKSADVAVDNNIPTDFTFNGSDMTYTGNDIPTLGLAYQLTLDKKYADAAYRNMAIMANYSHWNAAGKDLNAGACAKNVGTGLDLVYDALTQEQRDVAAAGIVRHIMNTRIGKPNGNTNNWNPVTNGGFGIGAIAIMNEYPQKAAEMLSQSIGAIPKSLVEYYPHGGFPEGQAYWAYMSNNLFGFTAALEETFDNDYGLLEFTGLSQTGYFPIYMLGPTRDIRFKYGDDNLKTVGASAYFYLAKCYNNPDFAQYQLDYIVNSNAYIDLAPYWCTDETWTLSGMYDDLPTDKVFEGFTPVATLRSAWEDNNALFAGIKGGYAQTSHSDLDMGTFIVAALGVEWSKELYPRITSRTGFPSQSRMSRYLFYASSPQGNNTLIFNPGKRYPDMDYGQEVNTYSYFDKSHSDENGAFAILNMSDAYRKYTKSTRRGIALINNRREFLIQDEIVSDARNLAYWFMHTDAEIEIDGSCAILKEGDKRLYMKILSPAKAEFEVMPAKALPRTPTIADFDEDKFRNEYKLSIKTEMTGKEQLAVWMVPLTKYDEIPTEEPEVVELDSWPLKEKDAARLERVTINGENFEGFSPEKLVYDITAEGDFNIEGFGEGVSITKKVYSDATILTVSKSGMNTVRYVFNKYVDLRNKIGITASDVPQIANAPENTIDGDFSTRWASTGEQNIVFDLGDTVILDSVSVAFYQGDQRVYNFGIEISEDGVNYTSVFDGKSRGVTDEFETHSFTPTDVRYVRVSMNRNNVNEWNNLSEIAFGYAVNQDDGQEQTDE